MNSKKIKVKQIRKRDGRVVKFEKGKVVKAVYKALTATGEGNKRNAQELAKKVDCEINKRFTVRNGGGKIKAEIPTVEEVQDIVENFLIRENYIDTAKAYIIYREQHRLLRESQIVLKKSVDLVDDYLSEIDWRVKENSNMSYSLQGLNNYIANVVTSKYWLEK
ncbi:MAG: ribonucleoside triphosphate reductase, partial [Candidatus Andersenbacteria bacterium]|nr:ribonucleoside triphosphate reductase [Candidatus Andersenbacteria bacterium]